MKKEIISGVILEQDVSLSFNDLVQICSVPDDFLRQLVDVGIIQPRTTQLQKTELQELSFAGNCLKRIRVSYRLHCDLDVNVPGIAVILDLLEARDQ